MSKKTIAVILELIPVISAPLALIMVTSHSDSELVSKLIPVTFLLAFLGFVFSFIGGKLVKRDKTVRILGVLDWLATLSIVGFYVLAFLSVGM